MEPKGLQLISYLILIGFAMPFIKDGALALDWEDAVLAGSCLTHAGEVRHAGVKQALGLG
jgi:NAD(P) transhydrogenase subunit alpha